jgi:hypothetical protein
MGIGKLKYLALIWLSVHAIAQESAPDVELPASELTDLIGDGGVELSDSEASGSLLNRLSGRWPQDLLLAPIPGRSPQFGWSLALGVGYFLRTDKHDNETPPSLLGGFAWYSQNGSYAAGLGGNLHLRNDDVRVQFGVGYLDVAYQYYGIGDVYAAGLSVEVLQNGPLYFGSASYRVWRKLYVGLGYIGGNVDTRPRLELNDVGPEFDLTVNTRIGAITIPVQHDSRDNEIFPREGWLVKGRANLYRDYAASDFDATTFSFSINKYLPVRARDVLAFRGVFRSTFGDAPFFLLSTFGGAKDLRGYPSGRYRDKMMYAVQGEYRWHVSERWILTGFAGVGETAAEFDEFGQNFLPAAGLGARFVISTKHRVSLSFDIARGKDSTEYYFGINEAF